MVSYKNINKYALISVYDKSKLNLICKILQKFNIGIMSTGSTFNKIKQLGYKCFEISKLTNSKEILEGRVKTLHPKIYSSILYKRDKAEHVKTFQKIKFPKIDYVIVNLYPFKKFLDQKADDDKIIEMIDIGGSSLIRAASKNFQSITTICSSEDYKEFCHNLLINNGSTKLNYRKKMAKKAFKITYQYDKNIFYWLSKNSKREIDLRYGENPNQKSRLVKTKNKSIFDYQIQGKKISYNNILDIDSGLDFLNEFKEPTAVIVKHNNACGIASSRNIKEAFIKAVESDKNSAFGGVVLFNKKITIKLAEKILNKFFDIVIAPGFDKKSIQAFNKKKNLILIDSKEIIKKEKISSRSVRSGYLVQKTDNHAITKNNFITVSKNNKISKKEYQDVLFAFKIVKHIKSNAIVLVKNKQTIGIGAGQMNRFDATRIAIMKYKDNFKLKSYVCASDAFFPFTDSLKILVKNNCRCIVQPSGSINDQNIIKFANKNNLKLLFSKKRVFKH